MHHKTTYFIGWSTEILNNSLFAFCAFFGPTFGENFNKSLSFSTTFFPMFGDLGDLLVFNNKYKQKAPSFFFLYLAGTGGTFWLGLFWTCICGSCCCCSCCCGCCCCCCKFGILCPLLLLLLFCGCIPDMLRLLGMLCVCWFWFGCTFCGVAGVGRRISVCFVGPEETHEKGHDNEDIYLETEKQQEIDLLEHWQLSQDWVKMVSSHLHLSSSILVKVYAEVKETHPLKQIIQFLSSSTYTHLQFVRSLLSYFLKGW